MARRVPSAGASPSHHLHTSVSTPRLILASSSPQRRELLEQAGYCFEVVPPSDSAEPGICSRCGPAELGAESALLKALDVARTILEDELHSAADAQRSAVVILSCDTVAECGGEILGKPRDEEHARAMLQRLSGSVHRVYSGVCLIATMGSAEPVVRLAISELEMDRLSEDQLDEYLASEQWRGKAGAFGYQDRLGWLRLLSGSESNVIGLPMDLVAEMLAPHNISP